MTGEPLPRRKARILVVDDEDGIRRLLRVTLSRMSGLPVEVHEAASAEEAIPLLAGPPFDLIISDYRMAGKTGVDLLEAALTEQPQAARVLVTAFAEMEIGVEAINRGHVDGFLRKPWDNVRLLALVESLLRPRLDASDAAASGAAPSVDPAQAALEAELADVNRALQKLRVRLGLGSLSPEGYQKAADELGRKRADLEARLLRR